MSRQDTPSEAIKSAAAAQGISVFYAKFHGSVDVMKIDNSQVFGYAFGEAAQRKIQRKQEGLSSARVELTFGTSRLRIKDRSTDHMIVDVRMSDVMMCQGSGQDNDMVAIVMMDNGAKKCYIIKAVNQAMEIVPAITAAIASAEGGVSAPGSVGAVQASHVTLGGFGGIGESSTDGDESHPPQYERQQPMATPPPQGYYPASPPNTVYPQGQQGQPYPPQHHQQHQQYPPQQHQPYGQPQMAMAPMQQQQQQQQFMQQQSSTNIVISNTVANSKPVDFGPQWQKPLCSCFDDCSVFFTTWCFFCCAKGQARHAFDGYDSCGACMICMPPMVLRNIVREGYNIEGNCCEDILLGIFCPFLTICQAWNEAKVRGPVVHDYHGPKTFQKGLFSCFDDMGVCLLGCFCTICTYAMARSEMDESNFFFNCCFVHPCVSRGVIRMGYGIPGGCCDDCMTTLCCPHLSACQLLNEVRYRKTQVHMPESVTQTVVVMQSQQQQQQQFHPQQQQQQFHPQQQFAPQHSYPPQQQFHANQPIVSQQPQQQYAPQK